MIIVQLSRGEVEKVLAESSLDMITSGCCAMEQRPPYLGPQRAWGLGILLDMIIFIGNLITRHGC